WRPLRLVPFAVTISEDRRDLKLPEKLQGELPGILAWAVQGCLAWQRDGGLTPPESVQSATQQYRASQDAMGAFLDETCVLGPDYRIRANILFERYSEWARDGNERVLSKRAFGEAITQRGIQKKASNGIWYIGVALRPATMEDSSAEAAAPGQPD